MTNNDLLIRLRYALDIKDIDMVKIFKLGGKTVELEDVKKMLSKPTTDLDDQPTDANYLAVNDVMLDHFLNGFVVFKRGPRDNNITKEPGDRPLAIEHPNNLFFKKVKVALSLTTDDIIEIFKLGDTEVSKSELSALLRKPEHRHYRVCLDSSLRRFLKGLAIKYRR